MGLKKMSLLTSHQGRGHRKNKSKPRDKTEPWPGKSQGTMAKGSWRDGSIYMIGYTAENPRYAILKQILALPYGSQRVNSQVNQRPNYTLTAKQWQPSP